MSCTIPQINFDSGHARVINAKKMISIRNKELLFRYKWQVKFLLLKTINHHRLMHPSSIKRLNELFAFDQNAKLGGGSYGEVFKGYSARDDALIAVKRVRGQAGTKSFDREKQIMNLFKDIRHPNIIQGYGYIENGKDGYLMFELCKGGDLENLIKKTQIQQIRAISMFKQLLSGMVTLNKKNKVHRDLKPENILLDENGVLKIADFGLARGVDLDIVMTRQIGTKIYGPPQFYNDQENYDERCDVWSMGLILYEILTGQKVFNPYQIGTELNLNIERNKFQNPHHKLTLPENLDPHWESFVNKMVRYDINERPNFQQISNQFKNVQDQMKNEICAKYGINSIELQRLEDHQKISKISPYQQSHIKASIRLESDGDAEYYMTKKIKQEDSYTILNKMNKWITFIKAKNQLLIKLAVLFNNSDFDCMSNVFKYILLFLSGAAFVVKNKKLIDELKKKVLYTNDEKLVLDKVIEPYSDIAEQTIRRELNNCEADQKRYEKVYKEEICSALFYKYMKRPDDYNRIMAVPGLKKLLERFSQNQFESEEVYLKLYQETANKEDYHFINEGLPYLNREYLEVYLYIRIIAKLDEFFLDKTYEDQNYIKAKLQTINNAQKDELIDLIKRYN